MQAGEKLDSQAAVGREYELKPLPGETGRQAVLSAPSVPGCGAGAQLATASLIATALWAHEWKLLWLLGIVQCRNPSIG